MSHKNYKKEEKVKLNFPEIFIYLTLNNIKKISDIFYFLKNESPKNIHKLFSKRYEESVLSLNERFLEQSKIYKNCIDIIPIINQWKEKLICFQLNHPTPFYFFEIFWTPREILFQKMTLISRGRW